MKLDISEDRSLLISDLGEVDVTRIMRILW